VNFEFDYEPTSDSSRQATRGSRSLNARITDDGLELTDALGTSRIPWQMIDRVEPGPEVWVFYVMSERMWLPTWALVGDPGKFILEKVSKKSP
jgi:YcxB-like protein